MGKHKIMKTVSLLDAIRKFITHIIWTAIFIVILSAIGRYIFFKDFFGSDLSERNNPPPAQKSITAPIDWNKVDKEVAVAISSAQKETSQFASNKLDGWFLKLMKRVDNDFLDWYFSYWTQQVMGLESLWHSSVRLFISDHPSAAEKITEEIQAEFSKRVLRPNIAELEMERLLRETLHFYLSRIHQNLKEISLTYKIPQAEWSRYLEGISVMTANIDANRKTPITLKTLYASGAGGAVIFAAKFNYLIGKLSSKVAVKTAGKAASKIAAKTGGKVAAKAGGKFLGTIVGVGVLVWDVWDHESTKQDNRPILRESIHDYFSELKDILLNDPQEGILLAFHDIESQILESIERKQK